MEAIQKPEAWNKGKLVGQKPPLKLTYSELPKCSLLWHCCRQAVKHQDVANVRAYPAAARRNIEIACVEEPASDRFWPDQALGSSGIILAEAAIHPTGGCQPPVCKDSRQNGLIPSGWHPNAFHTRDTPLDRTALSAAHRRLQACHEFGVHGPCVPGWPPACRTALQSGDAMRRVLPQVRQLEPDPFVFSDVVADVA